MKGKPKNLIVLLVLLTFAQLQLIEGQLYPAGWIKNGECLDMNQGPLQVFNFFVSQMTTTLRVLYSNIFTLALAFIK